MSAVDPSCLHMYVESSPGDALKMMEQRPKKGAEVYGLCRYHELVHGQHPVPGLIVLNPIFPISNCYQ